MFCYAVLAKRRTWYIILIVSVCMSVCMTFVGLTRQHPSYGDCLEVKREYYQNCFVLGCVTQCSQSAACFTGPADWVCHIGTLTLCVEAVA